ncbi:MAG: hypothetical protein ACP5P9_05790 [Acidimicrobiales bacterium]
MPEPLGVEELVDGALEARIGPFEPDILDAVVGICTDALAATVGPRIFAELETDRRRVLLVAPWVSDLASGLFVLERFGPRERSSSELLDLLSTSALDEGHRTRMAESVDVAASLTLDRVLEHVLGRGACGRDPRLNAVDAPWLSALTYGYRVHVALELLRLLPSH